jgi:hypothetical protein
VPAGLQAVEPATKPIKRKSLNFIN